ncbi:MAG TPA: cyclase family protein [Saprospiraceae bacterium]|nr:cyclase family protein [Saprospiraceae bacterium]
MKDIFAIFAVICLVLLTSCQSNHPIWPEGKWIDLTYSYDHITPFWPTADGFRLDTVFEGITEGNYYYSAFSFQMAEHGGTHIDAPVHFAEGKNTVDQIPLEQLQGQGVLIDITEEVRGDIDYQIMVEDLQHWETKYGDIPDGSIVLLRTGFGQYWPDKLKYMGTDKTGPSAVALLHFPGLHPEAAQWLVDNRKIHAIGIDTPSIDYGRSGNFLTHRILMGMNIPAFENVANLDQLPDRNFYVIALPMKIRGGSGGPLRIVAFLPE